MNTLREVEARISELRVILRDPVATAETKRAANLEIGKLQEQLGALHASQNKEQKVWTSAPGVRKTK